MRPASGLDGEVGNREGRRERDELENLPLENRYHRSSSVVRSRSAKGRVSIPTATTNSNGKDKEDDRTPTSRGSFWGKE